MYKIFLKTVGVISVRMILALPVAPNKARFFNCHLLGILPLEGGGTEGVINITSTFFRKEKPMKKLLFILSIFFATNLSAQEAENTHLISGNDCGEECSWTFDDRTGILTVSGNGVMKNWGEYNSDSNCDECSQRPWNEYSSLVTKVVVDGLSTIGNRAFTYFQNLESVEISSSVTEIGRNAFLSDTKLKDVAFDENSELTKIGRSAFNTTALTNINLPQNVDFIDHAAFAALNNTVILIPDSFLLSEQKNLDAFFASHDITLLCSKQRQSECSEYINSIKQSSIPGSNLNYELYENLGSEYFYNGKYYTKPNDIGTPNYIKKRIYTIDEANKVTGTKNRISIKYR